MTIKDLLQEATRHGYRDENAEAYVCQNLVLLDKDKLNKCINTLIFSNSGMREKTKDDIYNRVSYTFSDPRYRKRLAGCQKNWLDIPVDDVLEEILRFLIGI